jgi:hypothetical protein
MYEENCLKFCVDKYMDDQSGGDFCCDLHESVETREMQCWLTFGQRKQIDYDYKGGRATMIGK